MTKDNVISAVFGILLGFIAGYLMHEVMESRQPPRFVATVPGGQAGMAGAPQAPAPAAAPQQDMAAAQAAQQQMQQLEQLVQENPNDAQAILQLANLNFDQSQWAQARDLYSRYLQLQPENADVTSDLGVVYRGLKEYDKALDQFEAALRLKPDHILARYNKAIVLAFDLKRYDDAVQVVAELQRLQPGNPRVAELAAEIEKQRNAA